MSSYEDFAYVYDELTGDIDYALWGKYLNSLIKKHAMRDANLVCDLACGTGSLCNALCDMGYDMTGIDISDSMLTVAVEKTGNRDILYLNQDITEFELYGTMDVFVCTLDSMNHLGGILDIKKVFSLIENYLNPGGIFIFDVNTAHKFENILSNNTFTYDGEDIFYVWENEYDGGVCDMFLNFFVKRECGDYFRITEQITERLFNESEICKAASDTSLKIEAVYDEFTLNSPHKTSERVFYILRKNS